MLGSKRGKTILALLLALAVPTGLARAQQLTVLNESGKQTILTIADLQALPHVKVSSGAGGAAYEGARLDLVLEKGGVDFTGMRGKRMASCLLVEAADGYSVVIALPEIDPAFIDPAFNDREFILGYLKDGKPMDEKEGPLRIVIPQEKRMARWVRQVTRLKIVAVQ
jgi:hypothetical protein